MRSLLSRANRGCGMWLVLAVAAAVVFTGAQMLDAGSRATAAAVIGIGIAIAAVAVADYFRRP